MPGITTETEQLSIVMNQIKTWPRPMRIALAKYVLETLDWPQAVPVPGGRPVEELIGLGAGSSPAPDDDQVQSWVNEHRMERYGSFAALLDINVVLDVFLAARLGGGLGCRARRESTEERSSAICPQRRSPPFSTSCAATRTWPGPCASLVLAALTAGFNGRFLFQDAHVRVCPPPR